MSAAAQTFVPAVPAKVERIAYTTNPNYEGTDIVARIDGRHRPLMIAACNGHGQTHEEGVAFAAHIARTWNSHDALVAALEMARAQVELRKEDARAAGGLFSGFDKKLEQIDAALKAAKGKA